jgi:hypothetical protein
VSPEQLESTGVVRVGEGTLKEFRYSVELIKTNPVEGRPDITFMLSEYVQRFQLVESMFHKAVAFDMTFLDGGGFYDRVGIEVNDRIRVRLFKENVPNSEFREIDVLLYISDIGPATVGENAKNRSFLISAATREAHLNAKLRVRRAIRGTPQSIAQTIASGWLSTDLRLASSDNKRLSDPQMQILFPSCTPFQALDMVVRRSKSLAPSSGTNVQCFKSVDGPLVFMSLAELFAEAKVHEYSLVPFKAATQTDRDYFRFGKFKQHKHANLRDRLQSGMLVGEHVEFNMIERSFTRSTFRFRDDYRDVLITGEFPPFNSEVADRDYVEELGSTFGNSVATTYRHSQEAYGAAEDTISSTHVYDSAQKASIASIVYSVEFMGNSDIRAGDIVDVTAPSMYQNDTVNEPDLFFAGKFVVGSVRHVVRDAEEYTTFVDLFKDGYDLPIGEQRS